MNTALKRIFKTKEVLWLMLIEYKLLLVYKKPQTSVNTEKKKSLSAYSR